MVLGLLFAHSYITINFLTSLALYVVSVETLTPVDPHSHLPRYLGSRNNSPNTLPRKTSGYSAHAFIHRSQIFISKVP